MELRIGMLAISKAGHDKDSWYVIQKLEGEKVFLVNGENRSMERPKMKKRKHLQLVNKTSEILEKKLQAGVAWTNEEVKRALKIAKQD